VTESPADLLCRAASLMRDRAHAATPGPWAYTGDAVVEQAPDAPVPGGDYHLIAEMDRCEDHPFRRHQDAAHIASWHPRVALWVALWLDTEAEQAARYISDPHGPLEPECGRCGGYLNMDCTCWDSALAVARTYLGEEPATCPQPEPAAGWVRGRQKRPAATVEDGERRGAEAQAGVGHA